MGWGERSCIVPEKVRVKREDGNTYCGIATEYTCNVGCPYYEWDKKTRPDSQPIKHGLTARQTRRRFKLGRNDPCPCGSGKKSKNCCKLDQPPPTIISRTKKIFQAAIDVNK